MRSSPSRSRPTRRVERTPEEREAIKEWNDVSQKYFSHGRSGSSWSAPARWRRPPRGAPRAPTPFGAGSVKALAKLIELQRKVAQQRHGEALATARSATTVLTVLVCVGLGLGLGLAYVISRGISHPLRQTVEMLKDIAEGEGDLTKRLEVRSTDELGQRRPLVQRHHRKGCTTSWSRRVKLRPSAWRRRSSSRGRRGTCRPARKSRRRAWRRRRPRWRRSPRTVKQNADNARQASQLAPAVARTWRRRAGRWCGEAVDAMSGDQPVVEEDRRHHHDDRRDRVPDEPAGAERGGGSGARRRAGPRLRGGGGRGAEPGAAQRRRRRRRSRG